MLRKHVFLRTWIKSQVDYKYIYIYPFDVLTLTSRKWNQQTPCELQWTSGRPWRSCCLPDEQSDQSTSFPVVISNRWSTSSEREKNIFLFFFLSRLTDLLLWSRSLVHTRPPPQHLSCFTLSDFLLCSLIFLCRKWTHFLPLPPVGHTQLMSPQVLDDGSVSDTFTHRSQFPEDMDPLSVSGTLNADGTLVVSVRRMTAVGGFEPPAVQMYRSEAQLWCGVKSQTTLRGE